MLRWAAKRNEDEDRREHAFEALLDRLFARFLSVSTADLELALQETVEELGRFVGVDRSYIIRHDWHHRTSSMTHEWCAPGVEPSFDVEQRIPMSTGPLQQARLEALEVSEIPDVGELGEGWDEDRAYLESEGITAILEVPFSLGDRLAGVIGFDSVSGPVQWRPTDVTALKAVASLIANVLARRATEATLNDTLQELRAVFGSAPVPLMLLDHAGVVLRANPSASEMFGLTPEELVGSNCLQRIHPSDLEAVAPRWLSMLETDGMDVSTDEVRFLTPAGYRWHRVDATATRDPDGRFRYSTVHIVDVDDARRTASQLGRSERRFGSLVENLPDAVMRFDQNHRVTFANAAAISTSQEMAAAGTVMRAGWPRLERTSASTLRESLTTVFAKGRPVTVEYPVGTGQAEMWCESTFVPEFAADGSVESVLLVARDITHRRVEEAELAHRATHDTLTGLPNRSLLLSLLAQASAAREGADDERSLALLFLDVDRFKTVNDTLGHSTGDELLCAVADRLGSVLRPSDTLARLGGDEFTVLLPDVGPGEAAVVADRLRQSLEAPIVIDGMTFRLTMSIGVVESAEPAEPADLLRWADAAMYEAKTQGRDRACTFDERMRAEVSERNELDRDLTGALDRREFVLHYQPEVDLETGATVGCEALVRWLHPELGIMSADRFISLAEENGTIVSLGRWVLREACRTVARWRAEDIVDRDFVLRVNLSARQIDQTGLAAEVAELVESVGLDPSQLCLEITETALMRDVRAGMQALTELHEVGVRLAVDDFGTGYSSLSYLKRFPLDVLKVDRSFVDGLPDEAHDVAITTANLQLARSLGLSVTAEGVETPEQRDALLTMGCRHAQGYLFSRPVPEAELLAYIAASRPSVNGPLPRHGDAPGHPTRHAVAPPVPVATQP
ncbi:bifunctional diguanylate cyclase/phosphodiesterase [Dermatobacter hominis]|uniref:bifunctional diguanylate cyclase/phosphodiesterase n=1 Tax=Dermatobacter hominis TaxID=2884263 RepID=UPI001D12953A|nr:EAL domain-containing protein [Dermatobacter hominis]UDY34650.1 EAL domain-containing protein [Dermatobacter hominis]